KIDVHAHFVPDFYKDALYEHLHANPDGMPGIPDWTLQKHLAMMDKLGISKSILSLSSPGLLLEHGHGNDHDYVQLARKINEYAADLKQRYPTRLGFFACLPLPDLSSACAEVERAWMDDCDGFVMMTNYGGKYLGDHDFDALFDKMNTRKTLVFIHPTTPCIHVNVPPPDNPPPVMAAPLEKEHRVPHFEFLIDTARAVSNLFVNGFIEKFPNITYILPHVGGCFPPLFDRIIEYAHAVPPRPFGEPPRDREKAREQFRTRFYFDLAGWPFSDEPPSDPKAPCGQVTALLRGYNISPDKFLYGTDYPFATEEIVTDLTKKMEKHIEGMDE
ncbi:hypothetical protein M011DRAFT_381909, partial [Sporormia fimetaria CBS 119925]